MVDKSGEWTSDEITKVLYALRNVNYECSATAHRLALWLTYARIGPDRPEPTIKRLSSELRISAHAVKLAVKSLEDCGLVRVEYHLDKALLLADAAEVKKHLNEVFHQHRAEEGRDVDDVRDGFPWVKRVGASRDEG